MTDVSFQITPSNRSATQYEYVRLKGIHPSQVVWPPAWEYVPEVDGYRTPWGDPFVPQTVQITGDVDSFIFEYRYVGDNIGGRGGSFTNLSFGTIADTDGDGVANRHDLDSDNDGISDLLESGADAAIIDLDDNGIIDSGLFTDPNGDGWDNSRRIEGLSLTVEIGRAHV